MRSQIAKCNFRNFWTDSFFNFHSISILQNREYASAKSTVVKNRFRFENEFSKKLNERHRLELNERYTSANLMGNEEVQVNFERRRSRKIPELKYRGEILFGIHTIYLALLERRRKFHCLFVRKNASIDHNEMSKRRDKIIDIAKHMNIPIYPVHNEGLKYLAPNAVHQGICLDAGPLPLLEWEECKLSHQTSEHSLQLVISEILDPMNVGAIVRSAYYFGVRELFVTKGNSCRLSPTVSKASSGSLEVMDIYHVGNLEHFIKTRKSYGWSVFSTMAYCENQECIHTTSNISTSQKPGPKLLILGNEGKGISPEIQQLCDGFISIQPKNSLHEGIDSLNVSVAAGIILYSMTVGRNTEIK